MKGNALESLSTIDTNGGFRIGKLNPRELFEWKGVERQFSRSLGIDFAKQSISSFREREINPFVIDQIVEVPTDKWQWKLEESIFPSCFRGELNRNKVTIASPVVNTDLSLFNTIRDIAIVWHPRRLCDFPIKMFIGRETFFFCRIRVVFSIVEGFANDTFFQMME